MRTPFFNPPSVSSSGGSSVTIATTWGSPTSDEEVPSEKLAKDTLDSKQVFHGVEAYGAISFDNSTHILTVASGANTYWYKGTKFTTAAAITCDLDTYVTLAANTLYYVAFDDASGTLKASTSFWDLKEKVPMVNIYWNGTAGAVTLEAHNHTRPLDWHINHHLTIGCRYYSGLALTKPTVDDDATLTISSGIIYDEDIAFSITQQTVCRAFYLASAGVYTWANYDLPYIGTSGTPKYLNTTTYTLENVGNSKYACYWVYGSLDLDRPIYIVPSALSAPYNTVTLARAEQPPALSGFGLTPEVKLIHRLIYNGNGDFVESADYRQSSSLPNGYIAATTAGAVTFTPAGNVAATNVQSAIEELDGEKMTGGASVADATLSGTPKVFTVYDGATPYYFKAYPTKA